MLGKNIFMIKIFKICSCAIKNENFLQELSDMSTIRQSMDRLGIALKPVLAPRTGIKTKNQSPARLLHKFYGKNK